MVRRSFVITAATLMIVVTVASASAAPPLNGVTVQTHRMSGKGQTHSIVDDAEVPGGKALRVVVPAASDQPWIAGLDSIITAPVSKGDKLLATVMLRVPADAPKGQVRASFQLNEAPYTQLISSNVAVAKSWTAYRLKLTAPQDFAVGKLRLNLQMAFARQTVDVGPILILNTSAKD
jgi:hypothetical protein